MGDLHIQIKKGSSTSTLRALAVHSVDVEYHVVPAANVSAALTELANIGQDESIYSANITEESGSVSGLPLPKAIVQR